MEDIKQVIANNISTLRTDKKLTQLELAEQINYSDKAVSKWERGESVPDIITLKAIADLFGVTVDYLINEHAPEDKPVINKTKRNNHIVITLISVVSVWLLGTLTYACSWLFGKYLWMSFVVCIPVSMVVLLVFNSIWGRKKYNMYIISVLMWSLFLAFFLGFYVYNQWNTWLLFIVGIPAQVVIVLCFSIKSEKRAAKVALKKQKKADKKLNKAEMIAENEDSCKSE